MIAFCLRVMVGCIVLFDHIDPDGAFVKNSKINVCFFFFFFFFFFFYKYINIYEFIAIINVVVNI